MDDLNFVYEDMDDLSDEEYDAKIKEFCDKYGFEVPSERIDSNVRYNSLPKEFCPVCNMKVLTDNDFIAFLKKKTGHTTETALAEIKSVYGNYKTFKDDMRK